MEQSDIRIARSDRGGIISLKEFTQDHREAIEYDLITSVGVELDDIGRTLSWGAFLSFIKNLDFSSALWRELHPEFNGWSSQLMTNILLADIIDVLSSINANLCGGLSHKKATRPKPYPRPWKTKDDHKKIGKGALPKNELREWIKNYGKNKKERNNGEY